MFANTPARAAFIGKFLALKKSFNLIENGKCLCCSIFVYLAENFLGILRLLEKKTLNPLMTGGNKKVAHT